MYTESDARYARAINPCHPLVPIQLFEAENLSLLLQEPLLVSAITCVAARYADLGQSFDAREPSRARIVEARLTEWILKRMGFVAMGSCVLARTVLTVVPICGRSAPSRPCSS